jgi:DNA-binding transcriptional ArsR family regulator
MDKGATPSLLPILRSQQQGEILVQLLGDPTTELSVSDLASLVGAPYASVHREIDRAEQAGLLVSRRVGNVRLMRANVDSPYFDGLADILVKAFGPPSLIGRAIDAVGGISRAFIYGSWAAAATGGEVVRPVADIDLLVLGEPDRDELYSALAPVERRLGREIQVSLRPSDWLERGSGSFHDTLTSRPLVAILLRGMG